MEEIARIRKVEPHDHVDGSIPVGVVWKMLSANGLNPVDSEAEMEKLLTRDLSAADVEAIHRDAERHSFIPFARRGPCAPGGWACSRGTRGGGGFEHSCGGRGGESDAARRNEVRDGRR